MNYFPKSEKYDVLCGRNDAKGEVMYLRKYPQKQQLRKAILSCLTDKLAVVSYKVFLKRYFVG